MKKYDSLSHGRRIGSRQGGDWDDDPNENRRCLSAEEYMKALRSRDDIFRKSREPLATVVQIISLCVAIMVGLWLSTQKSMEVATDFFEKVSFMQTATVHTVPIDHLSEQLSLNETEPYGARLHLDTLEPRCPVLSGGKKSPGGADSAPKGTTAVEKSKEKLSHQEQLIEEEPVRLSDPAEPVDEVEYSRGVLRKNPRDTEALVTVGKHYRQIGQFDSAAIFYRRALAEKPDNASLWNDLGVAHHFHLEVAKSREYARRKKIPDIRLYRSRLYEEGIDAYTQALSVDSSNTEALVNRAVLHDVFGKTDEALLDYGLAIRTDSTDAEAFRKRAGVLKRRSRLDEAIEDYTAAIRLDSSSYRHSPTLRFANAYFGRGVAYYRQGHYERAVADFDTTLQLSPGHELAMVNKGITLGHMKRYEKAIQYLTQAINRLSPAEYGGIKMGGHMHRANAYKAIGQYDKAIADYLIAITLPRHAPRASWRIAQCYALLNDYESAITWLQKAVSHGFEDPQIWQRDRDLAPLRNLPAFQALITAGG